MKTSALRKSFRNLFYKENKIADINKNEVKNKSKTIVYVQKTKPKKNCKTSDQIHA